MSNILVVNAGSSSMKYQLIDITRKERLASGLIERIGLEIGRIKHSQNGDVTISDLPVADHKAGFNAMLEAFITAGKPLSEFNITAVGHRVVQGGSKLVTPTLITDEVVRQIDELSALAPLHNPPSHAAIVAARQVFPDVPHVAVFDTAFHQTVPEYAYTYAIDRDVAKTHSIRRYGFHGTSHQYVSRVAAEAVNIPLESAKQIVLHMGNGASVSAVNGGKSVDTSMGLTPLEGLVMGTRSGDIDPSIIFHLHRTAGLSIDEIDVLLNKKSGILGLSGNADMRDLVARYEAGDVDAVVAIQIYTYRARKYIGAYAAALGGVDIISFTAGVGENNPILRQLICQDLGFFGIEIDDAANAQRSDEPFMISTANSKVKVLVVPTDEELEIATQTAALVA